MTQQTLSSDRLNAARTAVFVVFAMNGRLRGLGLPDPRCEAEPRAHGRAAGVTLLALSAGSIVGLPASGWISHRFGAGGSVRIGLASMAIGMTGVGLGVDVLEERWLVAAGLFAPGWASASGTSG